MISRRDMLVASVAAAGAAIAGYGWGRQPERKTPRDGADVWDFGAVGDGRTDDAAAVQRAIDSGARVVIFPPGRYVLGKPLRPKGLQTWKGSGAAVSVLAYGGRADRPPFNLLDRRDGSISDFHVHGIGFAGGGAAQQARSPDGQQGFAVYLRCGLQDVGFVDCAFSGFGDGGEAGGGMVLGGVPQGEAVTVSRIRIQGCRFYDNGNVPGLYISAGAAGRQAACEDVTLVDNHFGGVVNASKVQNPIYILGHDDKTAFHRVLIAGNRFVFDTVVDAGIELNWVSSFALADNFFHISQALPMTTAILVRDGCRDGRIVGNMVTSLSDQPELRGIALRNFQNDAEIGDILIGQNIIRGVTQPIMIDRGSRRIAVVDNRLVGRGASTGFGIQVKDAARVDIVGNDFSDLGQAVQLGHRAEAGFGVEDVSIRDNRFTRCAADGLSLVAPIPGDGFDRVVRVGVRGGLWTDAQAGQAMVDFRLSGLKAAP